MSPAVQVCNWYSIVVSHFLVLFVLLEEVFGQPLRFFSLVADFLGNQPVTSNLLCFREFELQSHLFSLVADFSQTTRDSLELYLLFLSGATKASNLSLFLFSKHFFFNFFKISIDTHPLHLLQKGRIFFRPLCGDNVASCLMGHAFSFPLMLVSSKSLFSS